MQSPINAGKVNIYCLLDPSTDRPAYVGATIHSPEVRLKQILSETYSKWTCLHDWVAELTHDPKVELIKEVPESNWVEERRETICRLRSELRCEGGDLVNGYYIDPESGCRRYRDG